MQKYFLVLAIVVCCSAVYGQTPNNPLLGNGQVVGKPLTKTIGTQVPKVAPQAGTPVGQSPSGQPKGSQANNPQASPQFDLKNVVAPVNPELLPPALRPQKNESLYDTAFRKWAEAFGLAKPPEAANTVTPGIFRRANERQQARKWWRD